MSSGNEFFKNIPSPSQFLGTESFDGGEGALHGISCSAYCTNQAQLGSVGPEQEKV